VPTFIQCEIDLQTYIRNFRLLPSREECLNDDIMPLIIPEEQYDANEISLRSKLSAVTAIKAELKK